MLQPQLNYIAIFYKGNKNNTEITKVMNEKGNIWYELKKRTIKKPANCAHWPVVPPYHYEFSIIILEIYITLQCYENCSTALY